MAEHSTLTGSSLHECKQISAGSTGDAGKVITPSGITSGQGVLRNLVDAEVTDKPTFLSMWLPEIDTTTEFYMPVPVAGDITKIYCVIDASFTGGNQTLACKINGTGITNGTITVTQSGSAAGDVDSATPTANNAVVAGDYIQVTSGAEATSTVNAYLTFEITRDAS